MSKLLRLVIIFTSCSIILAQNTTELKNETVASSIREALSNQTISLYYIRPSTSCMVGNLEGVCMTRYRCRVNNGFVTQQRCTNRLIGICCLYVKSCGQTTDAAISYFTNPEYPSPSTLGGVCQISVNRQNSSICQLQLTFLQMTLAPPDTSRTCKTDFISLGPDSSYPIICGENTGKTVYVDFDASKSSYQLIIDTDTSYSFNRIWNVKIKQISCSSPERAPTGCLMYYTSTSGSVSSFNYDPTATDLADTTNRLITNMNYGICIKPAIGYCQLVWSQSSGEFSFTMSGDATGTRSSLAGADCDHNYVIIPGAIVDGIDQGERFCGTALPTLTTNSQPYVLTVKTSDDILGTDLGTRGFNLNFRQTLC